MKESAPAYAGCTFFKTFNDMRKILYGKILYGLYAVCLFVGVTACSGDKKGEVRNRSVDPRSDASMSRTHEDSTALLEMTKSYLEALKKNDIEGALDMLYDVKGEKVYPLSDARKDEIRKISKAFPVLSYNIDEMVLYSDSDTEVRYTIEFFEKKPGDKRPNTMKCAVAPRRVSGTWYLTVAKMTQEKNYVND